MREVRCLSDDMLSSEGCDEQLRPAEREDCNPEPCVPGIGQLSSNMFSEILLTFLMILTSLVTCYGSNVQRGETQA